MNDQSELSPFHRDWQQLVARSIFVVGWLSLLFGILVGGLQAEFHAGLC